MASLAATSKVDFAVIDARLIEDSLVKDKKAELEEQKKQPSEYPVRDFNEPVVLHKATELSLSFKSLKKIDNLQTVTSLRVLRLDNNAIQVIENLGHLVHLEWLDLSFNNISRIEGLSTLTKLTDLSLFNNNISKLEKLDELKQLEVLSLGNNAITNLESLMYLRTFRTLRVLNLDGNPMSNESDYKSTIYALLPWVQYLDYAYIDDTKRKEARDIHQHLLLDLEESERGEALAELHNEETKARNEELFKAGLLPIEELKVKMWLEEGSAEKLNKLPGVDSLTTALKEKMHQYIEEAEVRGKVLAAEVDAEVAAARASLQYCRNKAAKDSMAWIDEYRVRSKRELRAAKEDEDHTHLPKTVAALQDALQELRGKLLRREIELAEECNDIITQFEITYVQMAIKRRDLFSAFFREVEDAENAYKEAVTQKAGGLMEQVKEGNDLEGLDEDTSQLLQDREAVVGAIQGTNDAHMSRMLACEDEIRGNEKKRQTDAIQGERTMESERNRGRVMEIAHAIEEMQNSLKQTEAEFLAQLDEEED